MGPQLGDEALVGTSLGWEGARPAGGAGGCSASRHRLHLWRHRQGGVGGAFRHKQHPQYVWRLHPCMHVCNCPCCAMVSCALPRCIVATGTVALPCCLQSTCFDDLFALHLDTLTWERVPHSTPWPCARESHSMAALPAAQPGAEPSAFLVFGGTEAIAPNDFSACRDGIWVFDVTTRRWTRAKVSAHVCVEAERCGLGGEARTVGNRRCCGQYRQGLSAA